MSNSTSTGVEATKTVTAIIFQLSMLPSLLMLYLLSRRQNQTPKGVLVGMMACYFLFVPGAIVATGVARKLYDSIPTESDWLHGASAATLSVSTLAMMLSMRNAVEAKAKGLDPPVSSASWVPMTLVCLVLSAAFAAIGYIQGYVQKAQLHTPFLGGYLSLGVARDPFGAYPGPDNALSVETWIAHVSVVVAYSVTMDLIWRWGDLVGNEAWKGLVWGMLPSYAGAVAACALHLFYNSQPILALLHAVLIFVGGVTGSIAANRLSRSNGWRPFDKGLTVGTPKQSDAAPTRQKTLVTGAGVVVGDSSVEFLVRFLVVSTVPSYVLKYGAPFLSFLRGFTFLPGLAAVVIFTALNAYKWLRRSRDPAFEGILWL